MPIPYSATLPTVSTTTPQVGGPIPYGSAAHADALQPPTPMPILTGPNQGLQGGIGTAIKDVATGFGKDIVNGVQGLGKGFLGAFGQNPAGFIPQIDKPLFDTTKMGIPDSTLVAKSRGEQVGKVLSTITQLAAPLSGGNLEGLLAKGEDLATKGANIVSDFAKGLKTPTPNEGETVANMITPKPTVKEARLAQQQGRFFEGSKPTLFKGGTPDQIAYSPKTADATRTILANIPDAAKMNPSELYDAVDSKISSTAEILRPHMEATPIKPETIQQINDEWTSVKKAQLENAPATEEPNVAKRQASFESFLKKSGNTNQADLWDTRIAYDSSIKPNVKLANINSPESLQIQKEEWLQNRAILSHAINDTTHGMGATSQKAFSDMTNMYEAKGNLLAKTKVNGPAMSQFNQFLKDNPKTAALLGGGTAYEVLKHLGVPLP